MVAVVSSFALRQAKAAGISAGWTPVPGEQCVFWRLPAYGWTVLAVEPADLLDEAAAIVVLSGARGERRLRLDRFRELYLPAGRLQEIG